MSRIRTRRRYFFDEHVSPRVARALHALGYSVQHVGQEGEPVRGTDDEALIEHARSTNQTIVTSNHDMIVLCCQSGTSVVWLDPRDKDIGLEAVTLLCFRQMAAWDEALEASPDEVCIVARKTKWEAVPLARAAHLAVQRGRLRQGRESKRRSKHRAEGALLDDL